MAIQRTLAQAIEDWFLDGDVGESEIDLDENADAFMADDTAHSRADVRAAMERFVDANRCDGCAAASETVLGTVVVEVEDEGNGWQTHHYCKSCADALGYSNGDEISLESQCEE